ncbi:hypothetical protein EVAR_5768_1 [Eumeta japonica]|uniref:Uncharacterized protein n=1 Tax=Eumeta variegata TaxID=151549 RepID=A0A4C1T787_EUMVA|nr:hypothetical protein EVAR_5768_1 [Eumeta japonica]
MQQALPVQVSRLRDKQARKLPKKVVIAVHERTQSQGLTGASPTSWKRLGHFGAFVVSVLQQPYVKLVLNIQFENPHCPSFLPTPQENRSPRRLRNKSEVRAYTTAEKPL